MAEIWTPENVERLLSLTTDAELREAYPELSIEGLRRRQRHFRREREPSVSDTSWYEFLSRGRTAQEIISKFGLTEEEVDTKLDLGRPGYELFVQRNAFNEKIYVFLPKPERKVPLKKPIFARHCATLPWVRVQFPESLNVKRIDIVPLFDVHFGHKACLVSKWMEYIEYIRTHSGVFTFLGGDLIENASKLSVAGGVYEQHLTPDEQIHRVIEMLRPIAHKILFSLPGNHEDRAMKHMGIDVARFIADSLEVPYYDQPIEFDLSWRGYTWRGHAQHGSSGSQTEGGKLNAAKRPVEFHGDFIHVYFSGHVHDNISKERTQIVRNYETGELELRKYFVVILPAFLGYHNTYAARMGWSPPASGSVRFSMYPNGDYHIGA